MENEVKRFTAIAGLHVATAQLIEKLKDGKPGDTLTDVQLAEVCGHPTGVGEQGYCYLQTAIKYVRKLGIVWERLRGGGCVKCLEPVERSLSARRYLGFGHRRIKRAVMVGASVNIEELPEDRRAQHGAMMSQLRVVSLFSKPSASKQFETVQIPQKPDLHKMLELFESKKV